MSNLASPTFDNNNNNNNNNNTGNSSNNNNSIVIQNSDNAPQQQQLQQIGGNNISININHHHHINNYNDYHLYHPPQPSRLPKYNFNLKKHSYNTSSDLQEVFNSFISPPKHNSYKPLIVRRCYLLIILSFLYSMEYLFIAIFMKFHVAIGIVGMILMLVFYILSLKLPKYQTISLCHVIAHCVVNFAMLVSILYTEDYNNIIIFQLNLILNLISISIFFPKFLYCIILISLVTCSNVGVQVGLKHLYFKQLSFPAIFLPNIILNIVAGILLLFYSYVTSIDLKESELKEKRIRDLFNTSSEALVMHKDGIIIDANRSFENLFQVKLNQILNSNVECSSSIWEFLPDIEKYFVKDYRGLDKLEPFDDLPVGLRDTDTDTDDLQPIVLDTVGINSIGEKFSVHVTIERKSKFNSFDLISIIDTSAREKLINASIALKKAEEINQAKVNLLTTVSHEVRTPINGILAAVDIIEKDSLNSTQREFLNYVKISSDYLLDMISGILDFSKIEAGKMEIERIEFNILTMLEETLNIIYRSAQVKGLDLMLFIDEAIPLILIGDPYRIKQILLNLLSNAIKFTEKGQVIIRVKMIHTKLQTKESIMDYLLQFDVQDSGIGIKKELIDNLFTAFLQLGSDPNSNSNKKYLGTGLGLSISKKLCILMKGDIKVESDYGFGSTFSFTATLYQKIYYDTSSISEVAKTTVSNNIDNVSLSKSLYNPITPIIPTNLEGPNNIGNNNYIQSNHFISNFQDFDDDSDDDTINFKTTSTGTNQVTKSTNSNSGNKGFIKNSVLLSKIQSTLTVSTIANRALTEFLEKQQIFLQSKPVTPPSILSGSGNIKKLLPPTVLKYVKGFIYEENEYVSTSIIEFFRILGVIIQPLREVKQLESLFMEVSNNLSDLDDFNHPPHESIGIFSKDRFESTPDASQTLYIIFTSKDVKLHCNMKLIRDRMRVLQKPNSQTQAHIYWALTSDNPGDYDHMDYNFYSSFLKKPCNLPTIVDCLFQVNNITISEELYFLLYNNNKSKDVYSEYLETIAKRMEKSKSSKMASLPTSISLQSIQQISSVSPPSSPSGNQTMLVKPLKFQNLLERKSSYSDHVPITRSLVTVNRSPRTTTSAISRDTDLDHSNLNSFTSKKSKNRFLNQPNYQEIEILDPNIDDDNIDNEDNDEYEEDIDSNNDNNDNDNNNNNNNNTNNNDKDNQTTDTIKNHVELTIIENSNNNDNSNNNNNNNSNNLKQHQEIEISPDLSIETPKLSNNSNNNNNNEPKQEIVPDESKFTSQISTPTPTTKSTTSQTNTLLIDKNSIKILLVDDNSVNVKVFTKFLKDGGYTVAIAWNGLQAVELVKKSYYPIIFMDYHMSVMSGDEATVLIRRDEREILSKHPLYRKISIIALTAMNVGEKDSGREKCLSCGMDDVVQKPVRNSSVMTNMVEKYLKNYTQQDIDYSKSIKESPTLIIPYNM